MRNNKAKLAWFLTILSIVVLGQGVEQAAANHDGYWQPVVATGWQGPGCHACCFSTFDRVGPLRRIAFGIRNRLTSPYWRGGYFPSYVDWCDRDCWNSCCCIAPPYYWSDGGWSDGVRYSTPAIPGEARPATPTPATATPAPAPQSIIDNNIGWLQLIVPDDARVFINESLTTTTGRKRTYISRHLTTRSNPSCSVRVEYQIAGQTITQKRLIRLNPGATVLARFESEAIPGNSPSAVNAVVTTELRVRVPADAKVFLAGTETGATGSNRSFKTTNLPVGKTWHDYTVRVELERDGKILVRKKTTKLAAGKLHELLFEFGEDELRVAQRDH